MLKVINVQFQVLDLRLQFPVSRKGANQKLNTVKQQHVYSAYSCPYIGICLIDTCIVCLYEDIEDMI